MKYNVGDIVEFNDGNGGFAKISRNYGEVVLTGIDRYDGRNKYLIDCCINNSNESKYYAFYEDEIKGLKN